MRLVSRGLQAAKAVKNMGRLRQILGVFGRHGLQTFLIRMDLERYMPRQTEDEGIEHLSLAERLRRSFELLGPTFVKLGQILANRPDMLPDDFIEEFKKLQDAVAPLPFLVIKEQVERELNGPLEQNFAWFNEHPLASASIAQVHEARLLTGEEVVVKVQRPGIAEIIKADVDILTFLARLLERYIPETRIIGPTTIVDEFFRSLSYELNFIVEGNTMMKVKENLANHPKVIVPYVYRGLTTERVLTMEKLTGVRITDSARMREEGIDARELAVVGVKAFFKMALIDGLFHGDLHGGNIFAMKDPVTSESRIGVIDFGIVGRLSEKSRDAFTRMVFALITEDFDALCAEYADLATYGTGIDFEKFTSEVRNTLAPYMGLTLKDMNVGKVLIDATRIAVRFNIRIPSDWMIVFKAIFTLEGLGRQLDPEFDILTHGGDLVRTAMRERYAPARLLKDAAWVARDVSALMQSAPKQIRWMLRKFNSNDFAVEMKIKDMEMLRRQMERGSRGVGLSIICAGFFVAASIGLQTQVGPVLWGVYPLHSVVCFTLGIIGFAGLLVKHWR